MNNGKVYLIGAGPGDIKLITVKGLECIQKADVIVYDRLANPRLLSYRRPDAELIYVGKAPDRHTLTQDEINQVLVEEGLKGKIVARLKGGDPYVFGRGGEEGEELRKAGVAFEEVPGITSAISVPAYAGIPITHRDFTSSFTVITGHEEPGKETSNINWPRLAQDPGTLVFLMGVGNLPADCRKIDSQRQGRENAHRPHSLGHPARTAGRYRHAGEYCSSGRTGRLKITGYHHHRSGGYAAGYPALV